MISREQAVACLRVLGVEVPEPADDPDPMSRPMALGLLLFLIEAAAAGDVDRLDQEVLRSGYQSGARSAAADHPRADDAWVTTFVWTRAIEDRLRRTALDLADTAVPTQEGVWGAAPAITHGLDAVLALLASTSPPDPHALGQAEVVEIVRGSLRSADAHLVAARAQIEKGRAAIRELGYEP
ncbi:hypothetical protein [Embleya hyalina]|uniref:Uncharacterized protein n=1 Tax=Embleya hyalina TaxID=516124 RepID=A0A401YCU5_9ACTN|nr:hypothetical protein [Embleya hyalina]GCD92396.1 hypothetical protein EHYA_00034 [Embleya hyalina]